jgi:hypothetical protein
VPTSFGDVRIDIPEISADQLDDLPSDPTARLYLMGNDWALRTATPVRARAMDNDSVSAEAIVRVAEPGPLIATKLQALPNRASVKEATDLLDILRLTLDQHSGPLVRSQIAAADPRLKSDAALHVERWFLDRAASLAG